MIDNKIDVFFLENLTCGYKRYVAVHTIPQHKESLAGNLVLVSTDKAHKGVVRALLCHFICGVELAFDHADTVDDFVRDLLSAAIHDFGHAWGCCVQQFLSQRLVFNVQDNRYLLLREPKYDSTLIEESKKCNIKY